MDWSHASAGAFNLIERGLGCRLYQGSRTDLAFPRLVASGTVIGQLEPAVAGVWAARPASLSSAGGHMTSARPSVRGAHLWELFSRPAPPRRTWRHRCRSSRRPAVATTSTRAATRTLAPTTPMHQHPFRSTSSGNGVALGSTGQRTRTSSMPRSPRVPAGSGGVIFERTRRPSAWPIGPRCPTRPAAKRSCVPSSRGWRDVPRTSSTGSSKSAAALWTHPGRGSSDARALLQGAKDDDLRAAPWPGWTSPRPPPWRGGHCRPGHRPERHRGLVARRTPWARWTGERDRSQDDEGQDHATGIRARGWTHRVPRGGAAHAGARRGRHPRRPELGLAAPMYTSSRASIPSCGRRSSRA